MRTAKGNPSLLARVKERAPGFYTERDGGDWYIVAPEHYRIAEGFSNRDDARLCLLWLAGDVLVSGWRVVSANDLAANMDIGQGYEATLWAREIAKAFPNFAISDDINRA